MQPHPRQEMGTFYTLMYKKKGRIEEQLTSQNRTDDDIFPKHALLYKRYSSLDVRQDFRLIHRHKKRRRIGRHLMGASAMYVIT
jgi:hypothetical protein